MNLREEFLALGNNTDLSSSLSPLEQDLSLPSEQAVSIRVKSTVRKSKQIATLHGKVTVNIATGTIITTASGDIIDTNLIQITSLEASKTLQAKIKYEKRMKNRGNKKK